MKDNRCFNTWDHGCIWGKEVVDFADMNKLAQKNGFLKSSLTYYGNILTYDTDKVYAFFRDENSSENYLIQIQ